MLVKALSFSRSSKPAVLASVRIELAIEGTATAWSTIQLLPIILNVIAVYRNAVQVLSGLNSVIDFARLTVSLPRFFSKTTLS
jgi:hypothetical protein